MNDQSNRAIQEQVKNGKMYALNLNDADADLCCDNARTIIAVTLASMEKFTPEYEEKKKFYEEVKNEFQNLQTQWDNFQEVIKKNEGIIKTFSAFKSVEGRKTMNVISDPHDEKRGHGAGIKRPQHVRWVEEAEIVLRRVNTFLTTEELWREFAKDTELIKKCNKNKTQFINMKGIAINGLIKHALRFQTTGLGREKGTQTLAIYKEKIGLAEWVNRDGSITQIHVKEFMFAEGRHPQDVRIHKVRQHADVRKVI